MNVAANPHCVGIDCEYQGHACILAIASTTHKDLHGMRMAKQLMLDFRSSIKSKYIRYQINHDDTGPRLGVLVSAKVFEMPDGETALGVIILKHSDDNVAAQFPVGAPNTVFDQFQDAIDIKILLVMHAVEMIGYTEVGQSLEDQLESFFRSHIVGPDGKIRINKYLVTKVGDFRIEVYPKDHRPTHCHIISKQRGINARFTIDPFDRLDAKPGKLSTNDEKIIKLFFRTHPDELAHLKLQAERLQLN